MKTLYIKPFRNEKINDLSELVALYKDNSGVINVGYPCLAPYRSDHGNMMGFNDSREKDLFIARDEFRDIEIDLPVYMIEVTDENKVMDSVKLNEVGYELDTHLAGDPVVLKALGIK